MNPINRQILFESRPTGRLAPENFRRVETACPQPQAGEVLLRTRLIQIDAAMRAWMTGPTYRAALNAGDVMAGSGLAEVIESRDPTLAPGDLVYAETGWQDYAVIPAARTTKVTPIEPLTHLLSVYGVAGLTAYLGLMACGQPKAGETVVVSAAAGAVGGFVGQIAKLKGCRTVGLAGGPDKCALLTSEFGYDAAVDYKAFSGHAAGLYQALQEATGGGADVYFDNVGGEILDAILFGMKPFGRVALCGAVSMYDGAVPYGIRGIGGMVSKRISMRGFIVSDFHDQRGAALAQLRDWVDSGQLTVREDILDGLERLPDALIGLLAGDNIGKRLVRVA